MSRLDQHIATVRSKLIARNFGRAFALATFIMGLIALLAVLVDKFSQILPAYTRDHWILLGGIGLGVCALSAIVFAYVKRPTREQTAAVIDEKLRLKEKFSTAIYVRPSSDPFAMAAVHDAETTASRTELGKQFPVTYPRMAWMSKATFAAALAVAYLMPTVDLFGRQAAIAKKSEPPLAQQAAKEAVSRALAAVESMPKSSQNSDEFRKLVAELHEFNKSPKIDDPSRASRRALQALQEVNDQATKEWDKAKKYAEAQNSLMQSLQPPDDAKGPVGEARKEIAKGNFDQASSKLEEAVKTFDKMDQKAKEDAAKQMQQAAQQLQQLANNPQVQQQIQQQLQQMGANQAQAKQMQQLMQQAAAGNQQAAQQLAQQAQQMAQQMNQGQGPNAQQQQQIQQAMQQMQAQANAQNQANGLAQAAQQMAQAMQQQGQQQPGGQQNPQAGQQMQQAQQQMKQALQNMQGVKQDLQQMAQQQQAAQQAMQQGQQCANGQCQGGAQGQQAQGQQPGGGNGQFKQGDPQGQPGNGRGGPGQAAGGNPGKSVSPFNVKMEQSPSQENEHGRILASYLVKDKADPGKQTMAMQELEKHATDQATDEIDSEHANRAAQKVAQEYFRTMVKESKASK